MTSPLRLPIVLLVLCGLMGALPAPPAAAQPRLFWTDQYSGSIGQYDPVSRESSVLLDAALQFPGGLVVDEARGYLYWIGRRGSQIRRARLDGSEVATVHESSEYLWRELALDPGSGRLFWTSESGLWTLGPGDASPELLPAGLFGMRIVADPSGGLLYAYRASGNPDGIHPWQGFTLLDGSSFAVMEVTESSVHASRRAYAYTFDPASQSGYWIGSGEAPNWIFGLYRTQIGGAQDSLVVELSEEFAGENVRVDPVSGKLYWQGGISNHTPRPGYGHSVMRVNPDGTDLEIFATGAPTTGGGLAFTEEEVFWANRELGSIYADAREGGHRRVVIESAVSDPTFIDVDPKGGRLYWSEQYRNSIRSATLDGLDVSDVASSLECNPLCPPIGLALDVGNRRVYWGASDGWRKGTGGFLRAGLDGQDIEPVVKEMAAFWSAPAAFDLEVDSRNGDVYLSSSDFPDSTHGSLQGLFRIQPDGTIEQIIEAPREFSPPIPSGVDMQFSIDWTHEQIYWSFLDGIYRSDLDGSNAIDTGWGAADRDPTGLLVDSKARTLYWSSSPNGTNSFSYYRNFGVGGVTEYASIIMRADLETGDVVALGELPGVAVRDMALLPDLASVSADFPPDLPADAMLDQVYPNPFAISTSIGYELTRPAHVRLEVVDLLGRRIAILEDTHRPIGRYETRWSGQESSGLATPPGVYLVRLRTGESLVTRPIVRIR